MSKQKKPTLIENENTVFFDVDYTLIYHKRWIEGIQNIEHDKENGECVLHDHRINMSLVYIPSDQHITLLKQCSSRGRTVFVWSNNGYAWANLVVKHLGLEKYVDFIMAKPAMYVDDKKADEFLQHVYLGNENKDGDA